MAPERGFEYYPPPEVPDAWQQPGGTGQSEGGEQEPQARPPMTPERRMLIISCVLIMIVSLAFILRSLVFTIRHVRVVGIHNVSWQQVALSAGLGPSSNYFNVSEQRIREGIDANRYLVYERMQKIFPNTLILYVRERQPVASINYIGIAYIMADDGMILDQTRNLAQRESLITVSGLALRDIREGKPPLSTKPGQVESAIGLVQELLAQGYTQQVEDINLSEPTSIYMTTKDGFSVHLGDGSQLRAKIGTARAVIEKLKAMQYTGGIIEATVPGEATYRPDSI